MPALPAARRKIDFPIPHPLVLAGVIQIIICAVNKRSLGRISRPMGYRAACRSFLIRRLTACGGEKQPFANIRKRLIVCVEKVRTSKRPNFCQIACFTRMSCRFHVRLTVIFFLSRRPVLERLKDSFRTAEHDRLSTHLCSDLAPGHGCVESSQSNLRCHKNWS